MPESLITHIAKDLKSQGSRILILKDPDKFLTRPELQQDLKKENILIIDLPIINQRIYFELRNSKYKDAHLVFIHDENQEYLEDMLETSVSYNFDIQNYLYGYHTSILSMESIDILESLHPSKNINPLSQKDTKKHIDNIKAKIGYSLEDFKIFKDEWSILKSVNNMDWMAVISLVSGNIKKGINSKFQQDIIALIEEINESFQNYLSSNFKTLITSNALKLPKIVSKIQEHISHFKREQKVALVVIDGLSFWQYLMLRDEFNSGFKIEENFTHSWVPSVTELSRQAIFKGSAPDFDYTQNPRNEEKLWRSYWQAKGFFDYEIGYDYNTLNQTNVVRLALVLKDLDEKMHGSEDYKDLIDLTNNWIGRSNVVLMLEKLLEANYQVLLTTDHGSIQAKGWRSLKGKEKLGTHNSRSQRHMNYSQDWIAKNFLDQNPHLGQYVAQDDNTIYFKNNYSFSSKDRLITHGGSHILEVLIPFVKITK